MAASMNEEAEKRSLLAWANTFLAQRTLVAKDLALDYADGVLLCNLLECIFGKTVGRYTATPKNEIAKLDNLTLALNYIRETQEISLISVNAQDILGKRPKAMMFVLYNLLRHASLRQLQKNGQNGDDAQYETKVSDDALEKRKPLVAAALRDPLMAWIKRHFPDLDIHDFWVSFRDGKAFESIIAKLGNDPELVYDENQTNTERLARAFASAEKKIGIPSFLMPEDLQQTQSHERSVTNYLLMLMSASEANVVANASSRYLEIEERQKKLKEEEEELARLRSDEEKKRAQREEEEQQKLKAFREEQERRDALAAAASAELERRAIEAERLAQIQQQEAAATLREKEALEAEKTAAAANFERQAREDASLIKQSQERDQELLARLTAALASESKWRETAEQWRITSEVWKERAEYASELVTLLTNEKQQLLQERESILVHTDELRHENVKADAEVATLRAQNEELVLTNEKLVYDYTEQNNELRAELYRQYREQEEVMARIRDETAVEVKSTLKHGRSRSEVDLLSKTIKSSATELELILKMADLEGVLSRRKPKAAFNSRDFKENYFLLRGDKLFHGSDSQHIKTDGLDLSKYRLVTFTETADVTTARLEPISSSDGSAVIEFRGTTSENTMVWVNALNTRINLLQYCQKKALLKDSGWGCLELVQFLTDHGSRKLEISNSSRINEALSFLRPAFLCQARLVSIALVDVDLDDNAMKVLTEIMAKNPLLSSVDLSQNRLSPVSVAMLADTMRDNKLVVKLNLDGNPIGDQGIVFLARILVEHPMLVSISLNKTSIGNLGVQKLVEGLLSSQARYHRPHTFPNLNLANNMISDDGIIAIANLVKNNATLRTINLSKNLVGDRGLIALADAIELNGEQIQSLDLSSNQLSSKGVIALAEALRKTSGQIALDLSDNKMVTRTGIAALIESSVQLDFKSIKIVKLAGKHSKQPSLAREPSRELSANSRSSTPLHENTDPQASTDIRSAPSTFSVVSPFTQFPQKTSAASANGEVIDSTCSTPRSESSDAPKTPSQLTRDRIVQQGIAAKLELRRQQDQQNLQMK